MDDVRISNPPVNPELLDALGSKFQEYHYDFKHLVRDICTSRVYQTAAEPNASNEGDGRNFSHAPIRRMKAEVLLDMLSEVTGVPEKFRGLPLGSRAVEIADGTTNDYFLPTFGRAIATDRLLVRSEDGPEPVAGASPAQRPHGDSQARQQHGDRR